MYSFKSPFTLMKIATATSHPNIAIIKYWGKEDIDNNICSNCSLSLPLTKLTTSTTISYSKTTTFILNGIEQKMPLRMASIIARFQQVAQDFIPISIVSVNDFPDSCGYASSASGYSALVKALDMFYKTSFGEEDLSILARTCSGSASRSIPNGIVYCNKLYSVSLGEWPELKIFSILISSEKKAITSTEGMLATQRTSMFYKDRLLRIDGKIKACKDAIVTRNFQVLCEIIIRESNKLHGMMFESYPPMRYITDEGYKIMKLIDCSNKNSKYLAAYTFDADPNPFIITLDEYVTHTKMVLKDYKLMECN